MMLQDIPAGTCCFIDANIFVYHLVNVPVLSDDCSKFFDRIERREITGVTSAVAVAEATHKVMLAEAIANTAYLIRGSPIACNASPT